MKVLIVGLGSIALKHISAIRKIEPDARFIALRSGKDSKDQEGVQSITHIDEVPSDIDFVIISNPTAFHASTIQSVSGLRKPLFIEKPLFADLSQSEQILQAIAETQIRTYVACNLRFHPVIQFLKNHLNPNSIEEVNIYCGSYLPNWRPDKDFRKNYSAHATLGGGVHLDLIHELDYANWLFGAPQDVRVIKRHVSSLQIDAIDYANYALSYPHFTLSIILNYYRLHSKRGIEIVTREDVLYGDLLKGTVTNHNNEVLFSAPEFTMADTYLSQMNYFLQHYKASEPMMNSATEAFHVLKLALHE